MINVILFRQIIFGKQFAVGNFKQSFYHQFAAIKQQNKKRLKEKKKQSVDQKKINFGHFSFKI